jgi:hypothetical protein
VHALLLLVVSISTLSTVLIVFTIYRTMQRIIAPEINIDDGSTVAVDEDLIADHLEKYFEANDNKRKAIVFSSPLGGIHVYCFAPSEELKRNYWTLVTMGISGTKMNVPQDVDNPEGRWNRCELMCYLPASWEFPTSLGNESDEKSWPIDMMRAVGMYVSQTGAWLGESHGLPNMSSDPPGQVFCPQTKLSHVILLDPSCIESPGFSPLVLPDGSFINFYLTVPLTSEEAAWKRAVGAADSIYYAVGSKEVGGDAIAIDYIIDPSRPCAVIDLNLPERVGNGE